MQMSSATNGVVVTAQRQEFPWNIVLENVHIDPLIQKKIRHAIQRLGRRLSNFHPELVHLQINLWKHPKRNQFKVGLTLRVPANILHAERSGYDLIPTLNECVDALVEEIEGLKAELRREVFWKRKHRREGLALAKVLGFAEEPMPDGTGPQTFEAMVRALFEQHYDQILRHVRRQIRHEELSGALPPGAVSALEIVNEIAAEVEQRLQDKPAELSWLVWFYWLARKKLDQILKQYQQKPAQDALANPSEPTSEDEQWPHKPKDSSSAPSTGQQEQDEKAMSESTAEVHTDAQNAAGQQNLTELLQKVIHRWPRFDRQVFELYFVEGFEPEEIGMVLQRKPESVYAAINRIQGRIRQSLLEETAV